MVNPEKVKKQWDLCCFCGNQKIQLGQNEEIHKTLMAKGLTQEEAGIYLRENHYWVCPTPDKHAKEMVPFEDLEDGVYYYGRCRNATIARWDVKTGRFTYMREKFGRVFPENIGYWVEAQPGESRFDEFKPYGKVVNPPFEIERI